MLTYEEMFPTDLGRRHVMKSRCIYFNNDGVVAVAEYNGYKHSLHSSVIKQMYEKEFRDGIRIKDGKVLLHYNLVDVEIISDWCSYVAKLKFVKEESMMELFVSINNGEVVNITDDIEVANEMMLHNQVTSIFVNNPLDEDEVNAAVAEVLANLA